MVASVKRQMNEYGNCQDINSNYPSVKTSVQADPSNRHYNIKQCTALNNPVYFGIDIVSIQVPHVTIQATNLTARVGLSTSRLRQTRLHNLFSFDLKISIQVLV